MTASTRQVHRIRLATHDRAHRTITAGDVTGLMTQPQRTRLRTSNLWIIPLVVGLAGAVGYVKFHVVVAAWSAIASSALGALLFAIGLTLCVCGSIAAAVIWWAFRQEHRSMMLHRAAVRQYLLIHAAAKDAEEQARQAA